MYDADVNEEVVRRRVEGVYLHRVFAQQHAFQHVSIVSARDPRVIDCCLVPQIHKNALCSVTSPAIPYLHMLI